MRNLLVFIFGILLICGALPIMAQDLPVDHATANVNVLVPDTWLFQQTRDNNSTWEPFSDIFGDGTVLVGGNIFPETEDGMNMKVAFINPTTGEVSEYWAFYTDDGTPYNGPFNEVRKDGNPARVAADRRSGGTHYITAMESTPYLYDEFNTGDRWFQKFDYDDRVAAVQIFDKTTSGPKPITNVIDPIYQVADLSGFQGGAQMRWGGDVQFLSNGNILTVVEDRTKNIVSGGNASIATIFDGETGKMLKAPFNASGDGQARDIWANVAPFKGGFVVRTQTIFTVYDNDGNMKYYFDQADFSSIQETGRGDGVRIGGSIDNNYVYFAGKDPGGDMVITRFDAASTTSGSDLKDLIEIYANEVEFTPGTFDRADIGVDENGNFAICYEDTSASGNDQMVARIFNNAMEPVTPTFFVFQNHDGLTGDIVGYVTHEASISMSNNVIVVAADGQILDKSTGALTPKEQDFAIVLENPLKPTSPVSDWEVF